MPMVSDWIEINAPRARVWDVFTDIGSYPSWNPFIRKMSGELVVGHELEIELQLGCWLVKLHPVVTVVRPDRELRWLARQPLPGLFDVERAFEFKPEAPERTRFVQYEIGRGLFAPPLMLVLNRLIARGYAELNEALKARVEQ